MGLESNVSVDLLRRYDRPGPRYTSYPTAVEFRADYGDQDYRSRLAAADSTPGEPLSLYVHLPFCTERCTYCGCHVVITRHHEVADRYLGYLQQEIDRLAEQLPHRRRVSQLHWGGGTPTYLSPEQIEMLFRHLDGRFDLEPDAEVAIEVDPRVTTPEQLTLLRRLGFNRISMGVQDLAPQVQEAIGRHQTEEQTRGCFEHCRELGFDSISLDLVYGLPQQTPQSFRDSLRSVLELRPDRLAIYSYAHVPWIRPHQKRIREEDLPDSETKLELFCAARNLLLDGGYRAIGMDHFALPDDELVRAMESRRLHRNFMGYTVKMGTDLLGLGVSAIGDVQDSYAQNAKKLSTYYLALDEGRFPIERGYVLDDDDRLRRVVIRELMCNFELDMPAVERRFGVEFESYFAGPLSRLAAPGGVVDHGFVEILPQRLRVTPQGRLFVRNVCMEFDRYLPGHESGERVFSRTV